MSAGVVTPTALELPDLSGIAASEVEQARLRRRLEHLARTCELAELHADEVRRASASAAADNGTSAVDYARGLRAALAILTDPE